MEISLPEYVIAALTELEHAGFKAYIVGGCVRDAALGIAPRDWDICTSSAPRETAAVFEKCGYKVIETGPAYGTVSVIIDGERMEITTFRSDGEYSDNRRPDSVSFVRDIFTDLARRDFTMNAMAYNGGLTDPFGGVRDIAARLIRCVGDPRARFREDALRIMRAVRFASELGFHIEDETRNALFENAPLLKNIAVERVSAELSKLLIGKHAYETLTEYRAALLHAIPELPESFPLIERAAARDTRQGRDVAADAAFPMPAGMFSHLAAQLAILFKTLSGESAAAALRRLRYPRSVVREVSYRISRGDVFGVLPRLADLALRGGDLAALGFKGPEIGKMLESLLNQVITGELPNERAALLKDAGMTVNKMTNAEKVYEQIRPWLSEFDGARDVDFLGRSWRVTGEGVRQLSGKMAHVNCKSVLVWYFTFGGALSQAEPSFEFTSLQSFSHGIFRGGLSPAITVTLSEFRDIASQLGASLLRQVRYGEAWLMFALPKIPVLLTYTEADDEFPALLDIKFSSNATDFLPFETLAVLHGLINSEFII
ncbi:MAG: DUF3786 domain-containing protein [Oscillospiraceae bacterium]|nr:DUF3786 domain-containing protein [Oscillospiraceae bacterium]